MSKKMMKRSLALGAAMAFVITGNVWAATPENLTVEGYPNVNGGPLQLQENEKVVFEASNLLTIDVWSLKDAKGSTVEFVSGGDIVHKGASLTSKAASTIKMSSANDITTKLISASGQGTKIDIKAGNNISGTGFEIVGNNAVGGDIVTVDAETVSVNSTRFCALQVGGSTVDNYYGYDNKAQLSVGGVNTNSIDIIGSQNGVGAFYDNAVIALKADEVNITTGGSALIARNSAGAYSNPATINIDAGNTEITTSGNAIEAMSHGVINITGGLEVDAKNVVMTRGSSTINVSGEGDVKLKGDIVFAPDADNEHAGANSNVNINLNTKDSYLKGDIYVIEKAGQTSADVTGMKLSLSNGATWTVTGDSFVNNLKGNGGIIELQKVNDTFAKVNILTKDSSENLTVRQAGVTADSFDTQEKQQEQLESLAGLVTEGGKEAADKFAIAEGKIVGAVTAEVTADGTTGKAVEAVNTVNKSIGEVTAIGMAHIRAHMNDMNKRMGELRNANGDLGVWTRMVRGEEEFAGAKSQYNQYQLGYDEKLSIDKRWTVGAAVTFAEGNGNFTNGSTENDSTAFAIYGSKLNNDGTFVDLIARYARLESDVTMGKEKADYSTNGMSVSAEFGKRIQQGNGLWIEPQVELTYGSIDNAEYSIDSRNVHVGDMDSLICRVGFSLGKDIKQGNVYARASYLYDFDGETETSFSNDSGLTRTIKEDLGGGWWEVGVGANINLSKATYIYADVEKTFGGEVDTNWQWNLGVRYSF